MLIRVDFEVLVDHCQPEEFLEVGRGAADLDGALGRFDSRSEFAQNCERVGPKVLHILEVQQRLLFARNGYQTFKLVAQPLNRRGGHGVGKGRGQAKKSGVSSFFRPEK